MMNMISFYENQSKAYSSFIYLLIFYVYSFYIIKGKAYNSLFSNDFIKKQMPTFFMVSWTYIKRFYKAFFFLCKTSFFLKTLFGIRKIIKKKIWREKKRFKLNKLIIYVYFNLFDLFLYYTRTKKFKNM